MSWPETLPCQKRCVNSLRSCPVLLDCRQQFIPAELPRAAGEHSMANDHLPPFLQALLQPARYDHPASDIRLVQTHISSVIVAGDFVYKFKKPVNFGFLDFSDLEKRRHCCEQELLLNRRLCPDIYL